MKKIVACALAVACLLAALFGCSAKTTEDIANQDQLAAEAIVPRSLVTRSIPALPRR